MKVLIVHNRYQSRHIGGEDVVYQNELEVLQRKLGKENVLSYEVSNNNLSKLKLLFHIWFNYQHYQEVQKIIQENNIDIVHVHNFYPLLTPSVFKAAKDSGTKVVHTLHNYRLWCISGIFYRDGYGVCELCTKHTFSLQGILNKCFRKSMMQSVLAQISFWYYRITKVFENIDYFFVLTNFQKEKVEQLGINKEKIIFKPNSLHMDFTINREKRDYIYVGRLEESKGIYELLKIWDELDERFILTVIGTGDNEQELRAKYQKKNIIFKGKCSREETLSSISKSKYLIQPSQWYETFGLTILEAMGFGIPVIGFDIGTRKDFIQDGVNGFLSSRDNLKYIIENSLKFEGYPAMSKNAIQTAKLYENDYMMEKQIEIYKNIMEPSS
ncbi:MAG: glycosyltransferase [Campylobacterales bacterium]|nr:glycosyltransferase [Campylobacterales bacterium]